MSSVSNTQVGVVAYSGDSLRVVLILFIYGKVWYSYWIRIGGGWLMGGGLLGALTWQEIGSLSKQKRVNVDWLVYKTSSEKPLSDRN